SALIQSYFDKLSDQRSIAGEVDEKVVAHAPCHEMLVVIVPALDEDFLNSPFVDCAYLGGDPLYLLEEPVEPVFLHVLRNLIFHHGGGSSAPLGVDEGKSAVVSHLSHHIQCLLEVFLGLSRESYDNIRRQ